MSYYIHRIYYDSEGRVALVENDNVAHLRPETAVREVCKEMVRVRDECVSEDIDGELRQVSDEPPLWYASIWDLTTDNKVVEWTIQPMRH